MTRWWTRVNKLYNRKLSLLKTSFLFSPFLFSSLKILKCFLLQYNALINFIEFIKKAQILITWTPINAFSLSFSSFLYFNGFFHDGRPRKENEDTKGQKKKSKMKILNVNRYWLVSDSYTVIPLDSTRLYSDKNGKKEKKMKIAYPYVYLGTYSFGCDDSSNGRKISYL